MTHGTIIRADHDLHSLPINAHVELDPIAIVSMPAISESWRVSLQINEALDNSNKTFTVPALTEWQILWIWVELTTTNAVGNRQLSIELQDNALDMIGVIRADIVQAASLTRWYMFAPGMGDLAAFRDTTWLSTPIPNGLFLSAGQMLRVWDNKAIAAAADDMIVQMQIASRSI